MCINAVAAAYAGQAAENRRGGQTVAILSSITSNLPPAQHRSIALPDTVAGESAGDTDPPNRSVATG